jgi:hypothetical protein
MTGNVTEKSADFMDKYIRRRIKQSFSVNNENDCFFRFSAVCEFVIIFKW